MSTALDRAAAHPAAAFFVRWQLAIILLFAPVFLFPSMRLVPVLLTLPAIWICSWLIAREPLVPTPLNSPLALMAIMVLVSVYATADIAFSLPKIAGVLLGYGVFFGTLRLVSTERDFRLAIQLFVVAGAALALLGILGTRWIEKVSVLEPVISRIPAVIRGVPGQTEGFQPNAVGGALVMFVPLQIAIVLARDARLGIRTFHAVLLAGTASTLLLTQSRGAWLALAIAMFCWMGWQSRRSRIAASAAGAIGIVAAIFVRNAIFREASSVFGKNMSSDVAGRMELWSRAITAIGDFPFTGMGMNMFRRVLPILYPTFFTSPETDVAHAHNHLLQAALDLGIPGLIAYLALWLGAAALLVRSIALAKTRDRRLLAGGVAAGMLAYFLFGTTDTIALGAKVGIFFWIALALIVALHRVTFDEDAAPAP